MASHIAIDAIIPYAVFPYYARMKPKMPPIHAHMLKAYAIFAGGLFLFAATVEAQETEVFYNLSDDPNSLQLLELSNIGTENGKEYLNIIDLFRGEFEEGLINTWEVDCARERMGIVTAMHFNRDGADAPASIDGEVIGARSSDKTWTIFSLVCDGKGNLAKRRVYNGPLQDIISRFWGM